MNNSLATYTENILGQLSTLLGTMSATEYQQSLQGLSGSTVGKHVRHIIEFYQCLILSNETGQVDYDKRERNKLIEEHPGYARDCIDQIVESFYSLPLKKSILLNVCYDKNNVGFPVTTTIERELIYNIEHTVHHMAIIKIGIRELKPDYVLPSDFGVAISTIKHQEHVHRNVLTQK